MKIYLQLQYRMTCRRLREAGMHPALGCMLGLTGFVLFSGYMFKRTKFAGVLLLMLAFSLLLKLSERSRNDFLLSAFGDRKKRQVRIFENLGASLLFLPVLAWKSAFIEAVALLALAFLMAMFTFRTNFSITIPTPFYADPFEFTTGFRRSFYLFPPVYALVVIAIAIGNLNLGIFAMTFIFLIASGYYAKPEDEYYVWIYARTPHAFLFRKITSATRNVMIPGLPVLVALLVFQPQASGVIILFYLIGLVFLWTMVLAKYSTYPQEMNLTEGILILVCIVFPPIMLVCIPLFYTRSAEKLKPFLND